MCYRINLKRQPLIVLAAPQRSNRRQLYDSFHEMISGTPRRRFFRKYTLLVVLPFFLASSGYGQSARVFKIGILTDAMVAWHTTTDGFRDGLKELDYVDLYGDTP